MLIGVLSDTHGAGAAAFAAVALLLSRGATYLLHCGDVGSESVLDALAGHPSAFVWGNTDFDRSGLRRYANDLGIQCFETFGELEFDSMRLAITHGDDARIVQRVLKEQSHDYLLVGHSHVRGEKRHGRVRVVNPGALYRAAEKTVALVDLARDRVEFLTVKVT